MRFTNELNKIPGITVYKSQSNFVMAKLDTKIDSTDLTLKLLENHNVFIKDLTGKKCFENGKFIRFAVRTKEEDDALIDAMKKVL